MYSKKSNFLKKDLSFFKRILESFNLDTVSKEHAHYKWKKGFLDGTSQEFMHIFKEKFDPFLLKNDKQLEEFSIILKKPKKDFLVVFENCIIVLLLKSENRIYLSDLRKTVSLIKKETKGLEKLYLKGKLCA